MSGPSHFVGRDLVTQSVTDRYQRLIEMGITVYILRSLAKARTYVGQTNNIDKRVAKHQQGLVNSTRSYRPWQLVYKEEFESRAEAMRRETWYKSPAGRKRITELISNLKQ